ncbi:PREDICTED: PXMP2/4 family protein 4-like [Nicrophorus vespilloides]|uniref:PXMP2/4 family protein 4-like n=1 Tax=Nicrophorus vespilloides TaxID=110193 RepID=A0ABM1MIG5_NICVS|nr:PREDICTED: PXMP2/4 family protein 4-like [Nicrophorus vespilloides]
MAVFSRFRAFIRLYPMTRGMLSYAAIWPTSNLIQQTIVSGRDFKTYDYKQALRFSLFGGLFTAPTLYCWIRLSGFMLPGRSFKTAVKKALIEQVTYGPSAMVCFFFGMSLLEGKTMKEAKNQVKEKLFPTYKVGICFWPVLQTINFCFITERNRVPFVSCCSLIWTCFLAYMHEHGAKPEEQKKLQHATSS